MSATSPNAYGIEFDLLGLPFPRYLYFTFWRPCLKIKDLTNFVINFIFALNDLIFFVLMLLHKSLRTKFMILSQFDHPPLPQRRGRPHEVRHFFFVKVRNYKIRHFF